MIEKKCLGNCSLCKGGTTGCGLATDSIEITPGRLAELFAGICGTAYVYTDPAVLYSYGSDQTLGLHFPFDVLVKPSSAEEIAAILKICNQYKIPVTPRGGGSGVTGGALPHRRGVVIATERLNKIIRISKTDAFVIAEAGVVTADLCEAVAQEGLYFPVAPSSSTYSFIGGNVAENAGSLHSCKYGTTERYVLNLEVVLPNGDIIWTGASVLKNATGINLTQLFVGSEGILGIVTKIVYRLIPAPAKEVVMLAAFTNLDNACQAVVAIRQLGFQPAVTELVTAGTLQLTTDILGNSFPLVNAEVEAQLLIELQEQSIAALDDAMEKLAVLLEKYTAEPVLLAETFQEKESLRRLRFSIGQALTANGKTCYRDVDMAVPLSVLPSFIKKAAAVCEEQSVRMICFGHVLDGNLHTMLLTNQDDDALAMEKLEQTAAAIYGFGISVGGTISGEHGIGLLQRKYMPLQFSQTHLNLMKGIKTLFDPNGILNPGKVL